jgi:hypothetical protein
MGSPFPGPQSAYQNPPIMPQYFQPSQFFISAIALGSTTTVTTTKNMNYVIGQQVRLLIPRNCGSRQLNGIDGLVIAIPNPNQVIININSSNANAFILATNSTTPAQIIAVGDINTGVINSNGPNTGTFIPGTFQNISPL